jgi:hypothetical protein
VKNVTTARFEDSVQPLLASSHKSGICPSSESASRALAIANSFVKTSKTALQSGAVCVSCLAPVDERAQHFDIELDKYGNCK